jgi:hypothetical protein
MPLTKACQQTHGVNSAPNETRALVHHFEKLRFTSLIDNRHIDQVNDARRVDAFAARLVPTGGEFIDVLPSEPALQNPFLHMLSGFNCDPKRGAFFFDLHVALTPCSPW